MGTLAASRCGQQRRTAIPEYTFITRWRFRAAIEEVFQHIADVGRYPLWWKGVVNTTELQHGDGHGVGQQWRQTWRSLLPYNLVFVAEGVRVEEPRLIEVKATGELEGTGVWELDLEAGFTTVTYTWSVRTTRPWMNLLAPIARPLFAWNHNYVMGNGGRGLANLLGVALLPG